MAESTIRRATLSDVEALLRIQREAAVTAFSHIFPQDLYPFPDDAIRHGWSEAVQDVEIETFIANAPADPVASVSIGHGYLRTLYVLPSHWGRGLGSELHDFALERLRARGVSEAKLWTLAENVSARRFYERRGWASNGETRVVPFLPHPLDVAYARAL